MANPSTLAQGSFHVLGGGTGLRAGSVTAVREFESEALNADYTGISFIFLSNSGQEVERIQSGVGAGEVLEGKISFEKYGGLKSFNIQVLRENTIPFFPQMEVKVIYNNSQRGWGYVDKIPATDQDGAGVQITGVGFSQKLKAKKISESYTNTSVNDIIEDIGTNYFDDIDINYNSVLNQAPSTIISSADWQDKSIDQIIMDLIRFSNTSFSTEEFIFGVNENKDFYFTGISPGNLKAAYFEGYKYQRPETKTISNQLVNQVQIYRATSADPKDTEFVSTVSDTDSIDNYGIYEMKLNISDFVDTITAESIATGIIEDKKDPKDQVQIQNTIITDFLEFGYYRLSNKKQNQKQIISEFSDLSDFTQSVTTSTVSINTDDVFTGRRCYKWAIASSVGDTLTKTVKYYSPTFLRIYVRQDVAGEYLKVTVNGTKGRQLTQLETDTGADIETDTGVPIVAAIESVETDTRDIDVPTANEWYNFDLDLTGFFDITSIELEVIDASTVDVLIDRLEIYTNSYIARNLMLQDAVYTYGRSSIKLDSATFGEKVETLTSNLQMIDERNRTAFDLFNKQ